MERLELGGDWGDISEEPDAADASVRSYDNSDVGDRPRRQHLALVVVAVMGPQLPHIDKALLKNPFKFTFIVY